MDLGATGVSPLCKSVNHTMNHIWYLVMGDKPSTTVYVEDIRLQVTTEYFSHENAKRLI